MTYPVPSCSCVMLRKRLLCQGVQNIMLLLLHRALIVHAKHAIHAPKPVYIVIYWVCRKYAAVVDVLSASGFDYVIRRSSERRNILYHPTRVVPIGQSFHEVYNNMRPSILNALAIGVIGR
jgi:hypothetical protein